MGRMPLPSIDRWEDVVEILTNKDKYMTYLTEFQQAHSVAQTALGDLNTKERADEYLLVAQEKVQAAVKLSEDIRKQSESTLQCLAEAEAKSSADIAERTAKIAEHEAALQADHEALNSEKIAFLASVETRHDEFAAHRADISTQRESLDAARSEFQAKKDKAEAIMKAFA